MSNATKSVKSSSSSGCATTGFASLEEDDDDENAVDSCSHIVKGLEKKRTFMRSCLLDVRK